MNRLLHPFFGKAGKAWSTVSWPMEADDEDGLLREGMRFAARPSVKDEAGNRFDGSMVFDMVDGAGLRSGSGGDGEGLHD
jgi:hypothetical protein